MPDWGYVKTSFIPHGEGPGYPPLWRVAVLVVFSWSVFRVGQNALV